MVENLKKRLAESVIRSHPEQAARTLEEVDPQACASVIAELEPEEAIEVLRAMLPTASSRVLQKLPESSARDLLSTMPTRSAAAYLRRLPTSRAVALAEVLPDDRRRRIRMLMEQRPGTAGALADPDVLILKDPLTVGETLSRSRMELIRATHPIPVVDSDHVLVGITMLEDLTSARKRQTIASILLRDFARLSARTPFRSIASHEGWRTQSAMPVVDGTGVFVGMISYEALRSMEAEEPNLRPQDQWSTSEALGDLFSTGVGGMFEALFHGSRTEKNHGR
ncbi:MAG: magnesium transporter MgtE N-terminal domain-containing protein [Myxococcota bacterium]